MSPKKPAKESPNKLRPDVAETAFRVFQEAVGEQPKTLSPSERTEKNPEAVKRGAKGGKKGGRTRANNLTSQELAETARLAAQSRWKKG
jgi:hypothetical protein